MHAGLVSVLTASTTILLPMSKPPAMDTAHCTMIHIHIGIAVVGIGIQRLLQYVFNLLATRDVGAATLHRVGQTVLHVNTLMRMYIYGRMFLVVTHTLDVIRHAWCVLTMWRLVNTSETSMIWSVRYVTPLVADVRI